MVKCEIVVPILVNDTLAAELDIESYFAGTFFVFLREHSG